MRTKTLIRSITIFMVIILSAFTLAEDPAFLQRLISRLQKYNETYPQEKIYLQFDKPFYKPGEDIWFNGFVLNSNSHKPSEISEVLYVDLSDPKGNVVNHLELVVNDGTAKGDFKIADSDMGGIYHVQAYTNWMKNFGEQPVFSKEIQVQRVITPRMLLKLEFEKEAYGPADSVVANLNVRNLKNETVNSAQVNFAIFLNGNRIQQGTKNTNFKGNLSLQFRLPDKITSADGLLQLVVSKNGTEESISRSIPIVLDKVTLGFYPEGGNLIENANSRVAFKALNEYQKAADVKGVVLDDHNNEVISFNSFHMGMGAFNIKPEPGKKYFAKITTPAGNNDLIPLPPVQPYGYAMKLTGRSDTSIEFSIFSPVKGTAYIAGQAHGNICYSQKLELEKGNNTIDIPTQKFPAGIGVFTLFRESGVGLCERLVFLNQEKQLNIRITPDKERYLPGEKVELKIESTDDKGKPIPAKLSLAIADDQLISFANDKQDNLISAMLLSSEVKGEIQKPSFYFDSNEPKAKEALDYLLMTQGWRRFQWTEIQNPAVNLTYAPEKVKTLSGSIADKDGKPLTDEITLMELGNRKRIIKLETTEKGLFSFRNTDPTIPVMLLAGKRSSFSIDYDQKEIQKLKMQLRREKDKEQAAVMKFEEVEEELAVELPAVQEPVLALMDDAQMDVKMNEDVQSLEEVVVVGYGTERKNDLTGSVVVVHSEELKHLAPLATFENHLQGRVAGVQVQPTSVSPGAASQIRIRGISSIGTGNEPLYVINGHPIGNSINYNFSNSSILAAEDIESIEVMHSPEASSLFGSRAANGAILITTRSGVRFSYNEERKIKEKFSSIIVQPRRFSITRQFYTEKNNSAKNEKRNNFNTTVYWNPEVITNEKGFASITFTNNDAVSAFRITAEGFTASGLIGRNEEVYSTILPVSVDAKLPAYLGFEDVLKIPVRVTNETSAPMNAIVMIDVPDALAVSQNVRQQIQLKPNQSSTLTYTLIPQGKAGDFPVIIKLEADDYTDEISQTITVKPVGFPMRASFSGKDMERNVRFRIGEAEAGTLTAELSAFPDVLSDLFTGAEGIFQQPYGCFEQTSSSTFPNILALQYLQRSGLLNSATEKKALGYIETGYKRLISYEVKGGGFEWFGHTPAHEALTAYGLIEFIEMKKVYPEVDDKIISRTRDWLLSRRKGDGSFELQNGGMDDFSRPSGNVSNVYITYALSETGTKGLDKEYSYNMNAAISSGDMYQLALMANIAHNLGKKNDYNRLISLFESKLAPSGFENLTASHSIVWSQGISLTNETIALWALAMMKEGMSKIDLVSKCINFIVSRRSGGMFGSTQATVLSLKALSEYAVLARSTQHSGEIQVYVNQVLAESLSYKKETREKLIMDNFTNFLTDNGEQKLKIQFVDTPEPLPYSVNISWYTKTPSTNQDCKVRIETALNSTKVNLNETVRLVATISNRTTEGLPMTMAVIGIPAGLSAQPWQLKELQDKNIFDFYEINNDKVYLYYRQMKPKETKEVKLDLKAEIPGKFTGGASSAYLYYTDEYKDWVKGAKIEIL